MFKSIKRIIYKASKIEEAKLWYIKLLDLQPVIDTPFLVIFKIGECTLSLVKNNSDSSVNIENSETYWEVDNIDLSYQKLIELGVKVHTPIKEILNIRIAKVIDPFGNVLCITGSQQDTKERTIEKKPSETAMIAAFARAVAAKEDKVQIKGPDYLAELFLTDEGKKPLSDIVSRKWAIQNLITPPLYGYFICRTSYIDSIYAKALSDNFSQIVFLGAGYDSRAYRFKNVNSNIRIFEMDAASTQNRKIGVLKNANIDIPEQVSFISINFKDENFATALIKSGFDKSSKTLFIWEGVTYYLHEEAIRNTLELINTLAPLGSITCFDYMTAKVDTVFQSEPFLFWIKPSELPEFMSNFGFDIIEHINPDEMGKKFLTLGNGVLTEKTLPYFNFVTAITSKKLNEANS
jgi:methyltransferase (TIGR00027 family)